MRDFEVIVRNGVAKFVFETFFFLADLLKVFDIEPIRYLNIALIALLEVDCEPYRHMDRSRSLKRPKRTRDELKLRTSKAWKDLDHFVLSEKLVFCWCPISRLIHYSKARTIF